MEKARLQISVRFLTSEEGGRRSGVPNLAAGKYFPHVVVGDPSRRGELTVDEAMSGHAMLGVRFVEGPSNPACGQHVSCVIELLYAGVAYSALRPGVGILVVEGRKIVATGNVSPESSAG